MRQSLEKTNKLENNQGGGKERRYKGFPLKDDEESIKVRLLIDDIDKLYAYSVHQKIVEKNGKKYYFWADCTKDENGSYCKYCDEEHSVPVNKIFVQMVVLEDFDEYIKKDDIIVWNRSVSFRKELRSLLKDLREDTENPNAKLFQQAYKIKRIGVKGSKDTKYKFKEVGDLDTSIEFNSLPTPVSIEDEVLYNENNTTSTTSEEDIKPRQVVEPTKDLGKEEIQPRGGRSRF